MNPTVYLTGFTIDGLGPGIDDHTRLPDADGILNAGTNTIKVHLTYSSKELGSNKSFTRTFSFKNPRYRNEIAMGRANAKHGYLILNANTKSYSS
jgi:hypothetical protein